MKEKEQPIVIKESVLKSLNALFLELPKPVTMNHKHLVTLLISEYESVLSEKQKEVEELREFLKECIKDEQINISDMRNEKMDMNSAGAGMCMGSLDAYRAILSFINDSFIINPTVAPPTKKGAGNE